MKGFFIGVFFLCFFWVDAQDIDYARKVLDTLCAPSMDGRGYVNDGHKKAALFIEEEFKRFGLSPLPDKTYLQDFKINVNTYPGAMKLKLNGKSLKPGEDFIIDPASEGEKRKLKVNTIDAELLGTDDGIRMVSKLAEEKKALLIQQKEDEDLRSSVFSIKMGKEPDCIIEGMNQKLTWHISTDVHPTMHFKIRNEVIPERLKKIKYEVDATYLEDVEVYNVAGYVPGTVQPDSFFVFTAHYDHIGRMGADQYIPGANDNASGTSMLLNLAKHYAENPAPYSIVFLAFGAEETGLIGSKHFVNSWWMDLSQIKFLINLDIVGGGSEGAQIVNSYIFRDAYNVMDSINTEHAYLPQLKLRGKAANSDHWHFFMKKVPCFFIYTLGGPPHYHDISDRAETLPLTGYEGLFKLLLDFVAVYK